MLADVRTIGSIHGTRVLSLDASGRIMDWISWQDATCLYVRRAVAWTLGDPCLTIHGGTNRETGLQSTLDLHPIVASTGHARPAAMDPAPALTNAALFARDRSLCMYCGNHFSRGELTRDHVVPISRGGRDAHAAAGAHAPACRSLPAKLGRAPDPLQSQHPGRPDGVSGQPPAPQSPSAVACWRRVVGLGSCICPQIARIVSLPSIAG